MGLAQKIQTLQANRRSAYVNSMNLSQSAKADLLIKVERSDADLEDQRRQNLCEMFHIYSERQLDPHARVTAIRREYMATDLKHCGYITHMATSKNAIITFLVEPERDYGILRNGHVGNIATVFEIGCHVFAPYGRYSGVWVQLAFAVNVKHFT